MSCKHKFLTINEHNNLLPDWNCRTLVVGTFNPENKFHPTNSADYFYQRPRNYFWDVFPKFFQREAIQKTETNSQIKFLKENKIGITDLLLKIKDADSTNPNHINLISNVKDQDIERFQSFTWNTSNIIKYLKEQKIEQVYFTKKGNPKRVRLTENTFEYQIRAIEKFCTENNIYNKRLHSPTGMGLGKGKRIPTLRSEWEINGMKNIH